MNYTDIAIIGGGLAGSTAAAMLGRAGIPTVLIDPHRVYPFDFRVEKISGDEQVGRLYETGIGDSVLRSATHDGENWIARFGYLLDKRPSRQYGIMYDDLIAAIRAEIPPPAELIYAKAIDIATSAERQKITLSSGETISARLVVLANGLSVGLRRNLGIGRQVLSAGHSISIGFDIVPVGRPAFEFPALTYFSERSSARVAYVTLFPIQNRMRANLFVYREIDDPWLREMRRHPAETMNAALPRLRRITGEYAVTGDVKIRPADIYVSTGYRQPGVVLVGEDKIASFYDDPVKQACDAWSMGKAVSFRKVTIENGPYWRAQRLARFLAWFGEGALRRMRSRISAGSHRPAHSSSSSLSSSA
jgi:2-polyprenyl-6-methoxyphenol hydroxylase-like FAD-dependent oxidoreductase